MKAADKPHAVLQSSIKPLHLVPVGLYEAAADSPSFRANVIYFTEQVDALERWLENYSKCTGKLLHDFASIENTMNLYKSSLSLPQHSESLLDQDYTLQAIQLYADGANKYWDHIIRLSKDLEKCVLEPIRTFIHFDIRSFRDARRGLDQSQKYFDGILAKYTAQNKIKEPSALREDAFQLHEAKKVYLRACMEFASSMPLLKSAADRLIIRILSDQWRDLRAEDDASTISLQKGNSDMGYIRSWNLHMEDSEKSFRRELHRTRKQVEEATELATRPSREIDAYAQSQSFTHKVPSLGDALGNSQDTEKQGWLFQRSIVGKPSRIIWLRRWFYLKAGAFGCLVPGARSGGVEESEKISVLLCSVKPASQEDRRFCFEVKTNDNTIVLQAESQAELIAWTYVFDASKREALEAPSPSGLLADRLGPQNEDAFALGNPTPLEAPEASEILWSNASNDSVDKSGVLSVPENLALAYRGSFDVSSQRRITGPEKELESTREHASRIIQKLDLHKKSASSSQITGTASPQTMTGSTASQGASNSSGLLGNQSDLQLGFATDKKSGNDAHPPTTSLAPQTLTNMPITTAMSRLAVNATFDRIKNPAVPASKVSSGLIANMWGTSGFGYMNHLDVRNVDDDSDRPSEDKTYAEISQMPDALPIDSDINDSSESTNVTNTNVSQSHEGASGGGQHSQDFIASLRSHDAQFRILFPEASSRQEVLLVFPALWVINEHQGFPGRMYLTSSDMFFYGHHMGFVLTATAGLDALSAATVVCNDQSQSLYLQAAQDQTDGPRWTMNIKLFIENVQLLRRRIHYLIECSRSDTPAVPGKLLGTLMRMELRPDLTYSSTKGERTQAVLEVPSSQPLTAGEADDIPKSTEKVGEHATTVKQTSAEKLSAQDQDKVAVLHKGVKIMDMVFLVSTKALFYTLFGDRSHVFQTIYRNSNISDIQRYPWQRTSNNWKRLFSYRANGGEIKDEQIIEVMDEHSYAVADVRRLWYLPHSEQYNVRTTYIITMLPKARSQLTIYTEVLWKQPRLLWTAHIETAVIKSIGSQAKIVAQVAQDQIRRLGRNNNPSRAAQFFGQIGEETRLKRFSPSSMANPPGFSKSAMSRRTSFAVVLDYIRTALYDGLTAIFLRLESDSHTSNLRQKSTGASNVTFWMALFLVFWTLIPSPGILFRLSSGFAGPFASPNAIEVSQIGISRTIYVKDIEELLPEVSTVIPTDSSVCRDVFRNVSSVSNTAVSEFTGPLDMREKAIASSSRKIRSNRRRLARQRNNLLVSMKVINDIDRAMRKAEWNIWLHQEKARCSDSQELLESHDPEAITPVLKGMVTTWHQKYCSSCLAEIEEEV